MGDPNGDATASLYASTTLRSPRGLPFRVSSPSALTRPLAFAKGFRHLRKRIPFGRDTEIDEEATIRRVADAGVWSPVFRPAPAPWLDLALVIDGGASMAPWWKTVTEIADIAERLGVFRDVRRYTIDTDGTWARAAAPESNVPAENREPLLCSGISATLRGNACAPAALVDSRGRRLVLILTDGISAGWRDGSMARALERWGRCMPTALLHVLPERLWRRTAVNDSAQERAHARARGSPTGSLHLLPSEGRPPFADRPAADAQVYIPLIGLDPDSIAEWARMLTTPLAPGPVMPLDPNERAAGAATLGATLDPRETVVRFDAAATPKARRLARLLSIVPLRLPVIRLVCDSIPGATSAHLAEVFLGGLLERPSETERDKHPEDVDYDFVPGVRDVLLSEIEETDALLTLARVSRFVENRLGHPTDFIALLAAPPADPGPWAAAEARPFAELAASVLDRFGDRYAEITGWLRGAGSSKAPVAYAAHGHVGAAPDGLLEPSELLRGTGEAHRRLQTRPLNEAKLIVVGRAGVGKTSLIRRLLYNRFDDEGPITHGIEISRWRIRAPDRDDVRLNLWDFGGQEIMHATHQFFLTQRSLYLLVLEGRTDRADEDAEYWLRLIEAFGTDSAGEASPVVIVLNKFHTYPFDIDRRTLRQKYPFIRDFVATDAIDSTGITELRAAIEREVLRLKHLDAQLPWMWFTIKEKLSELRRDFISNEEYRAICAANGEIDKTGQDSLAAYLHDLGIVLNFGDDPRLRDTFVLDPYWLISGLYRILNSPVVASRKGELWLDDVSTILDPTGYPRSLHPFLMEVMKRFQMCFSFPDEESHYLLPELLGFEEASTAKFAAENCLLFEYRYSVLLASLLPRFIVRTHALSAGLPRWRTGVILQLDDNRALVKAYSPDKRVSIAVGGPLDGRRRLLTVIRAHFEEIHATIAKLQTEEFVPLPHQPDLAVSYEKLLGFEKRGFSKFVEVFGDRVLELDVRELLDGVDVDDTRRRPAAKERPIILIADDMPQDIEWLMDVIRVYGGETDIVRDERAARQKLDLVRRGDASYVLAIVDIMLPLVDITELATVDEQFFERSLDAGLRLCKYARRDLRLTENDLPIICHTAREDLEAIRHDLDELGIRCFQREETDEIRSRVLAALGRPAAGN